jgi:hypothetical protein
MVAGGRGEIHADISKLSHLGDLCGGHQDPTGVIWEVLVLCNAFVDEDAMGKVGVI